MDTVGAIDFKPRYRWVIVAASAVMLAIAMGVMVNGISVFFAPLKEEFGWQRGSVALINLAGLVGLAFGGIVMGKIADRTSTRRVCMFGALCLSLCLLAAAWAQELWQFYMLFFLAGFLGAGALFTPLIANVGNWFKYGAGLAIGIASAGQAMGQGGIPFATALMIDNMGWRDTLTILGTISFVALIPLSMLIRQPPEHLTSTTTPGAQSADETSPTALPSNVIVAWLSFAVIFCCICMSVPLMHLIPLVQDQGISLSDSGSVLFLMLVVAIFGRIFFGKLADVVGAIPAYMIASFWQTALVFGFTQIETLNSFYIFAVIYGFGYSGVMTGILVCVRTLTPLAKRASALGVVTLFGWIGHAIGGYQGGLFFDMSGNYTITYANAAIAGVINLIIVSALLITISRKNTRNKPIEQASLAT